MSGEREGGAALDAAAARRDSAAAGGAATTPAQSEFFMTQMFALATPEQHAVLSALFERNKALQRAGEMSAADASTR